MEMYRELGISLHTDASAEESGLRWAQRYDFLSRQMKQQLGSPTEVRIQLGNHSPVVWLKTELSPEIWVRVPLTEIRQGSLPRCFAIRSPLF